MEQIQKITIDEEFRKLVPKPLDGEYMQLEENILRNGCREPLVLWQGILLDGHHRYEICQKHGLEYKTVNIDLESRGDAKIWMIHNQLGRRNLSRFQRIEMVNQLEAFYTTKGKENMSAGGSDKGLSKLSNLVNTRQAMATLAGVSEGTYSQAKEIIEKASEAEKQELREGKKSINRVFTLLESKKQQQMNKDLPKVSEPEGEFDVILCDATCTKEMSENIPMLDTVYVSDVEIIKIFAKDNCVLFLWATSSGLLEALKIMKFWGFTYQTLVVWNKQIAEKEIKGLVSQNELLLIGTKEYFVPPVVCKKIPYIYSEKCEEIGKKPKYYYQLIEEMFPNGKYFECFSSQKYNNKWSVDGNGDWKEENRKNF